MGIITDGMCCKKIASDITTVIDYDNITIDIELVD